MKRPPPREPPKEIENYIFAIDILDFWRQYDTKYLRHLIDIDSVKTNEKGEWFARVFIIEN